jgi:cytochrome c2
MRYATLMLLAIVLLPSPAMAADSGGGAGDAAAGKAVFNRCKICHAIEAGQPNPVGPNLRGVFGRKAGTADDYAYSPAMKKSGVVWNDDTLTKYLKNPSGFIPGNKMAFPGFKNDKDIADLLAYLHQAAGPQ